MQYYISVIVMHVFITILLTYLRFQRHYEMLSDADDIQCT